MRPRCLVALIAVLALAGCCGAAVGASGSVMKSAGHGLQLTMDADWLDGPGYRPVRVTVTPLAPLAADRTLRVEFLAKKPWGGQRHELRVVQDIDIPAGATAATPVQVTLAVPQYFFWNMSSLNVLEDGQLREKLCIPWSQPVGNQEIVEGLPSVLFVGKAMPDTSGLSLALHAENYIQQGQYYGGPPPAVSGSTTLPTACVRQGAELPERWIEYTSLDVVCLSSGQLVDLKAKHPKAFQAIVDWTAAGGNLWLFDAGADWQRLEELERLLGLTTGAGGSADRIESSVGGGAGVSGSASAAPQNANNTGKASGTPGAADSKRRGWVEPDPKLFSRLPDTYDSADADPQSVPAPGRKPARAGKSNARAEGPSAQPPSPFLLRPFSQGLIVAMAAEDPFPGDRSHWNWLLQAVGPDRLLWARRHGVSMLQKNDEFWNLLIPGVGLAPVTEFCVLITLFVLAIGPLNYWLLRRRKRLHLLVLTVPGGAGAVTLVLLTYALVADGLATRVRVRSVTQIDQRQRQAVCWARLSYYAGVAPSRGLSFPADVAVFPLQDTPAEYYTQGPTRDMVWEEQQRLASGWLNSRTPTQFVTVRCRPTTLGLELIEPSGASHQRQVRNELGTQIDQLLVRAGDGKCYGAAGIAAGATAVLDPLELEAAQSQLRRALRVNQPAYPPGMDRQDRGNIFGFRRSRYYGPMGGNGSAVGMPTQRTSRLEASLGSLAVDAGNDPPLFAPGSYVAIVGQSPEVVIGTPAREEASFHVIVGKW